MKLNRRWLWIVPLLAVGLPGLAQMYKWVDDDGTVHFDTSCPAGVECTLMGAQPEPTPEQVEAAARRSEELQQTRQQQVEQPEPEEQAPARDNAQAKAGMSAQDCENAFYEREVAEMLGVTFDGHPDPGLFLLPDDWEGGAPLRKDYEPGREQ